MPALGEEGIPIVFTVKKGMIVAAAAALAAVIALSVCFAHISSAMSSPGIFTVVIDAGHGGADPGVIGVSGTKESEINLAVAKALGEKFRSAGFRVVFTREGEGGLYGAFSSGFKRRDMQKRKEIIESAAPAAVISVHQNSFPAQPSRRGGQVFYNVLSAEGRALAEHIQANLNVLSGKALSALAGDYYMLNCTAYTSVIVECGFLSNAEEERLLADGDYREKLAGAVFMGALAFLS